MISFPSLNLGVDLSELTEGNPDFTTERLTKIIKGEFLGVSFSSKIHPRLKSNVTCFSTPSDGASGRTTTRRILGIFFPPSATLMHMQVRMRQLVMVPLKYFSIQWWKQDTACILISETLVDLCARMKTTRG